MSGELLGLARAVLELAPTDSAVARCVLPARVYPRLSEDLNDLDGILDHGEHYCSLAVGARTALTLYDAHCEWASGTEGLEEDQGQDLVVRLLAASVATTRLHAGSAAAQRSWLLSQPWGQSMLWWLAAVDLALSFGTEDDPVEAGHAASLVGEYADEALERLEESGVEASGALELARLLAGELDDLARLLGSEVSAVGEAVRGALPDLASNSVDDLLEESQRLPVMGLLLGGLAAEVLGAPPPPEREVQAEPEDVEPVPPSPEPPVELTPEPEVDEQRALAARLIASDLEDLRTRFQDTTAALSTVETVRTWCRQNSDALERLRARAAPDRRRLGELEPLLKEVSLGGLRVQLQHRQNQLERARRKLASAQKKLPPLRERRSTLVLRVGPERARLLEQERGLAEERVRLAGRRVQLARLRGAACSERIRSLAASRGGLEEQLGALQARRRPVDLEGGRTRHAQAEEARAAARLALHAARQERLERARDRLDAQADLVEIVQEWLLALDSGKAARAPDPARLARLRARIDELDAVPALEAREAPDLEALRGRREEANRGLASARRLRAQRRLDLAALRLERSRLETGRVRLRRRSIQGASSLASARLDHLRAEDRVLARRRRLAELCVLEASARVEQAALRRSLACIEVELLRHRRSALAGRREVISTRAAEWTARLSEQPARNPLRLEREARVRLRRKAVRAGELRVEEARRAVTQADLRAEEIEDRYENSIRRAGVLQRQVTGTESRLDNLRVALRKGARPPDPAPVAALPETLPALGEVDEAKTTLMTPEALAALRAELLGEDG